MGKTWTQFCHGYGVYQLNQVQDSLKKLILGKVLFGNDIPIQIKHRQSGKSGRYACGLRKSCEGVSVCLEVHFG
jgi:hypothetical protein